MKASLAISDDLINVSEAAKIIGCTVAWVRQLAEANKITGKKISDGFWAISKKSAENYAKRPQTCGRPRVGACG